jgi:hypothetical protein
MKILIANGCSHTAGSDIDPENKFKCPESAWPRWVADHYNIPYLNIAAGSSGNEQICRSSIISISNIIENEKLYETSDIIVCILWSGFDRYEYWSNYQGCHRSMSLTSTYKVSGDFLYEVGKYIESRSLIEPESYSNYKNLYHMYVLAKFLESYNIKYYFGNALKHFTPVSEFKAHVNLKYEYSNLLELYGNRKQNHLGFFDEDNTYKYILRDMPHTPDGVHWGIEGQQFYANHFIKHMEEVDGRMGN